ncbi:EF-hand domain-containing protein D2-like isoform X2 [Lethenteron reissneri]|uniref:EF-hand domain-containing protein D2-like isoform X2 n=1 Tax=Lethenteron reissneri TaxID=7753 RepID=UPI002AB62400|nr:EF-hand domain-containing protein D2-like isoform X2 [Lethenteron reissneri]
MEGGGVGFILTLPTTSFSRRISCRLNPNLCGSFITEGRCRVVNAQLERGRWHSCNQHNSRKDGYMDLMDLKCMMEKLGAPQTHLGLKEMIAEVDEDFDGRLSFREFLLIFHKAAAGELQEESGLLALARLSEIDVSAEGVKGAKNFFEAKVQAMAETSRFEAEIRAEQEEKRRQAGEQQQRRAAFRQLQSAFAN